MEFFTGQGSLSRALNCTDKFGECFKFVIAKETEYGYQFAPIRSYRQYIDLVKTGEKAFHHEVIHERYEYQKLFADIEAPHDIFSAKDIMNEFSELMSEVFYRLEVEPPTEVFICDASDPEVNKTSLHITFPEIAFKMVNGRPDDQKMFWQYVLGVQQELNMLLWIEEENEKYVSRSAIDIAVYQRNKNFRLPYSYKLKYADNPNRAMRPAKDIETVGDLYNYLVYSNGGIVWDSQIYYTEQEQIEIERGELEAIVEQKIQDVYVDSIQGSLIKLRNICGRTCLIGGEYNEGDNSYCVLYKDGIYHYCFNEECRGKSLKIHNFVKKTQPFIENFQNINNKHSLIIEQLNDQIVGLGVEDRDHLIEKTKERMLHNVMDQMNVSFCYIDGSRSGYYIRIETIDDQKHFFDQDKAAMIEYLNKRKVLLPALKDNEVEAVPENMFYYWVACTYRRDITFIDFWPPIPNTEPTQKQLRTLNMYPDFRFKYNHEWDGADRMKPFLTHLMKNWCKGNAEHYKYVIQWFAHGLQKPYEKKGVALVLRSDVGAGKGIVMKKFEEIYNEMYFNPDNCAMDDKFSGWMMNKLLIVFDEAIFAGSKKVKSKLKEIITEETITVEAKYKDRIQVQNFASFVFTSNESWVVPADLRARRYLCLDLDNYFCGKTTKTSSWLAAIKDTSAYDIFQYLMRIDISDFDRYDAPKTAMLDEQIMMGLSNFNQFWLDYLTTADFDREEEILPANMVPYSEIFRLYEEYPAYSKMSKIQFNKQVRKMFGDSVRDSRYRNIRCFDFSSTDEVRKQFCKSLGINVNWDGVETVSSDECDIYLCYNKPILRDEQYDISYLFDGTDFRYDIFVDLKEDTKVLNSYIGQLNKLIAMEGADVFKEEISKVMKYMVFVKARYMIDSTIQDFHRSVSKLLY